MKFLVKLIALILFIILLNVVLLNIFHAKDYIVTAISVGVAILAAGYGDRKRS